MKKNLHNLGQDIRKMVNESVKNGDFSHIGKDLSKTMNSALDIAFDEVRSAVESIQNETKYTSAYKPKQQGQGFAKKYNVTTTKPKRVRANFPHRDKGNVKSILYFVFGGVGLFGTGLALLLLSVFSGPLPLTVLAGAGMAGFLSMIFKGTLIRKQLKRYKQYLEVIRNRVKVSFNEIADFTGKSPKYVYNDIRKMIQVGIFPQGHALNDKSYLLLNHASYHEYKDELKQQALKREDYYSKGFSDEDYINVEQVIKEGKDYISSVQDANVRIKDPEVSNKIYEMEATIKQTMDYIESHPNKVGDVRRLMQYYLPTTLKLLNAYHEFESQPVQTENIRKGREDIRMALDDINMAFHNLYNNLQEDASMEISADISVMQTMMEEEGLVERRYTR